MRAATSVSQLDGLIANRQCANFPVVIRQQQSTSAGSNLHQVIALEIRHRARTAVMITVPSSGGRTVAFPLILFGKMKLWPPPDHGKHLLPSFTLLEMAAGRQSKRIMDVAV